MSLYSMTRITRPSPVTRSAHKAICVLGLFVAMGLNSPVSAQVSGQMSGQDDPAGTQTSSQAVEQAAKAESRAGQQSSEEAPRRLTREERAMAGTPSQRPKQIEDVTIIDRLGNTIDHSITLTNSEGKVLRIGEYFDGTKPSVIAMVYYNCPVVCTVTMKKLLESFNELDFTIGRDFNVIIVSFDHTEQTPLAASVKAANLAGYRRGASADVRAGWTFHTATAANAKALGDEIGFQYKRLSNGEFSHPVSTVIVTPDGTVARYFHGFELPRRDLELALLEASNGRIARTFGHVIAAFCYRFNPADGSYSLSAFRVMQIGGILTVIGLVVLIGGLFAWERWIRRPRLAVDSTAAHQASALQSTNRAERPSAQGNSVNAHLAGSHP